MPRLTKEQKAAIKRYDIACAQEERLSGSVFATPERLAERRAEVIVADLECERLGVWQATRATVGA